MSQNAAKCCGVSCKMPEKMPDRTLALYGGAFLEFIAFVFFGIAMLASIQLANAWENSFHPQPLRNHLLLALPGVIGLVSSLIVILAARIMARQFGHWMLWLALLQPALVVLIPFGGHSGEVYAWVLLGSSFLPAFISIGHGYLKKRLPSPKITIPS